MSRLYSSNFYLKTKKNPEKNPADIAALRHLDSQVLLFFHTSTIFQVIDILNFNEFSTHDGMFQKNMSMSVIKEFRILLENKRANAYQTDWPIKF